MKNTLLLSMIAICTATAIIARDPKPALADGIKNNFVGPFFSYGGSTSLIGIDSKLGIADNISLRPFMALQTNISNFLIGTSVTYDFDLGQSAIPIKPFIGAGIEFFLGSPNIISNTVAFAVVGGDFNISDNYTLSGSVSIPFNSNYAYTTVGLTAGLRF